MKLKFTIFVDCNERIMTKHLKELHLKLDAFSDAFYRRSSLEGLVLTLAVALSGLLILGMVEFFAWSSSAVRGVFWWSYIVLSLGVLVYSSVIPFLKSRRLLVRMTRREAALLLSEKIPEIEDKLINVLDLETGEPSALVLAALDQKSAPIVRFQFANAIDSLLIKRFGWFNGAVIVIWAGLWLSNSAVIDSVTRVKNYQTIYERPAPFEWIWENDSVEVRHNDPVELRFSTVGEVQPERAQAIIDGRLLPLQRSGKNFVLEIPRLRDKLEFQVEGAGIKSRKYTLIPQYFPVLSGMQIRVQPPAYTGLEAFVANSGNFNAPEGSAIEWTIQSVHADSIFLKLTTDTISLPTRKGETSIQKNVYQSSNYRILLKNHTQNLGFEQEYSLLIQADQLPVIEADWLDEEIALRVFGSVRDDYGLRNVFFQIETNSGYKTLEQRSLSSTSAAFRFDYDLSSKNPGEVMRFRVGVTDNDGIRGGKTAYTAPFEVRKKSREEIEKQRKESISGTGTAIENFEQQTEENRRESGKLIQQKKGGERMQFKDEQQLRDLMRNDAEQLEKAIEALEELQNTLEKSGDEEDQKKAERLEEQKNALQDLLDEIRELLDKNKPEELLQKAEEIQRKMQERSRELKTEQRQMEKMENLRDLLRSIDELQELEQELGETETGDSEKLEEIRDKLEDWEKKAEKALEKFPEMQESLEDKKLGEESEKAREEIDQAKESPKQGDAQKKKDSAQQRMKKMQKEMMDAFMQMQQQSAQENMEDLRQLLRNLILLSFSQEKQSDAAVSASVEEVLLRQIIVTQQKIDLAAEHIIDSLYALAERVPEIESKVRTEALRMLQRMDLAKQALRSDKVPNFGGDMKASMEHSNELALLLDQILQQMMMDMGSEMSGDQNCNKPGKGQPDISELLDQQKGLGEQSGQEEEGSQEGDQGSEGKKGSDGNDGDEESAEAFRRLQMMMRQEEIRRNLQEILRQQGREGEGADVLELMEEQERDIILGRPYDELQKRQKEIEIRMLELEKAERKQSQDEERRGETGQQRKMPASAQEEYIRKKMEEIERIQRSPFRFTPYYEERRQKVLEKLSNDK